MKKVNFVKRCAYGVFCTLSALSILLTSSCQKDASTASTATVSSSALSGKLRSSYAAVKYVKTAAIYYSYKNNITINADSINGGSAACIQLAYCNNVHITHCKLMNSSSFGIYLNNCSNVLIDSCYIANVGAGVYAEDCHQGQIRVMYNQMQNMKGPYPHADFIQFDRVYGTYNRICYNKLENIYGQSNPEDGINTYMSTGTSADPIYIIGNEIRGGGPSITGSGICVGDNGGSYQVVESNILVSSGYGGIDCAGGNNMQILNNTIYSPSYSWSGFGLGSNNFASAPSYSNKITGNKVYWIAGHWGGYERDTVYRYATGTKANPMPSGWKANTVHASINASILPATLIDYK
jgi:hypothetical protein